MEIFGKFAKSKGIDIASFRKLGTHSSVYEYEVHLCRFDGELKKAVIDFGMGTCSDRPAIDEVLYCVVTDVELAMGGLELAKEFAPDDDYAAELLDNCNDVYQQLSNILTREEMLELVAANYHVSNCQDFDMVETRAVSPKYPSWAVDYFEEQSLTFI